MPSERNALEAATRQLAKARKGARPIWIAPDLVTMFQRESEGLTRANSRSSLQRRDNAECSPGDARRGPVATISTGRANRGGHFFSWLRAALGV